MELHFLGTSSGTPTRDRNVTGLALRHGTGWDLFDCGEGTQHRLLATPLPLPRLQRVFVSHLHGDHCFGLFGLLGSRSLAGATEPLTVFGPRGLEAMVRGVLEASSSYLGYPLAFHELGEQGGRVVDDEAGTIDAVPLTHRVTCFAWWIREASRPGAFDVDRALALGVPRGPLLGRLQRGEAVHADDGQLVRPEQVLGPPRPGRTLIIAGDNRDPASLLDRTGPVQLLVHESTFTEDVLAQIGDDRGHSTAARVATAAAAAGVSNLVLTHFSPRFAGVSAPKRPGIDDVRREAESCFAGRLHLAADLDRLTLDASGALRVESVAGTPGAE